jgi:biopolymer transport protein ExbD
MARHKHSKETPELDITCFMNLMIVLVPVLLINMVIASTSIIELKLPAGASGGAGDDSQQNETIELIIRKDHLTLNYPAGILVDQYAVENGEYDFKKLSKDLQQLKRHFVTKDKEKKDILILSEPDTDYQTLVSAMDTVRSYKAVVVTDVVNAELFPDISLGDAP